MSGLVDRYLLYRIKKDLDADSFARLYDRYVTAIYRFVLLKLPSTEDAEDITSEVFLKTWNYLQEHHDVREFRALLYRIARASIADWYRGHQAERERTLAVTNPGPDTTTYTESEFSDRGCGSDRLEIRAEFALLMGRLEQLKDDYRDVLMLRLVDGLPFNLIAEIMEKSPGNVRVLYYRAKKSLDALNESHS
jgi:RNA polymerase sigma-70 factor (ECF subfamily)